MTDTKTFVKDITFSVLENTKVGESLQNVSEAMKKTQEVAYAYVSDDSPKAVKTMRIGTAATFAILEKIAEGTPIKDFTKDDWGEIAKTVAETAIEEKDKLWSVIVFTLYADYVDISANVLEERLQDLENKKEEQEESDEIPFSKEKSDAIRALAKQVRDLEKELNIGNISEPDYTEQCLWILLEAMIKLISAYTSVAVGKNASEFIQSVSMLAFEYGRYALYRKEQELLELYLQHQKQVDEELQEKLDVFKAELNDRMKEFDALVADAFAPDVMQRFRASVELARNAGVDEGEILKTTAQVDEFFA